ncbi:MAG: MFS transporter [Candidatus Acidiferrales bacterium]
MTPSEEFSARPGHYRWTICALLFFATTINYMDRQVISLLAPTLQHTFGWSEIQYADIIAAFQIAYMLGLFVMGGIIDRIGTRLGYALAIGIWSVSAMCHALARSVLQFGAARFMLGLGESGNFPASLKAVAEWFPKKERALATGLFNSGTNVGALIAPIAVPWIALHWGWRWAFVFTGIFSATWLVAWLTIYRQPQEHPKVSASELAYIQSDPPEKTAKIPWLSLLPHRQTWAFVLGKFCTDPVWWFFLFWLPKLLNTKYGVTLAHSWLPLVVIYSMASVGSIAGGWLSGALLRRGWHVNPARKTAMLICALAVTPVILAAKATNLWVAVGLFGVTVAAHQGWSANLFTLASDMFPKRAVASVVGIGTGAGAFGGFCIAKLAGYLLQWKYGYTPLLAIAASAYLIALLVIQLLAPRLEPVALDSLDSP